MRDRFAAPHRTFMPSFWLCVKKLRRRRFQKAGGINAFEDASVWEPSPGGRPGARGAAKLPASGTSPGRSGRSPGSR